MIKSVVSALCFAVLATAPAIAEAPAVVGQNQKCLALEVPQQDSGVRVSATYAGQQYEFHITVDGKPVDLQSQANAKDLKAACVFTS